MPARFNSPLAKPKDVFRLRNTTIEGNVMVFPFRLPKRWTRKPPATPDYTNQLDLFSEAPIDTQATVAPEPAPTTETSHARPRPPEQPDPGPLEPPLPVDAGRVAPAETPPPGAGGDGGAVHRPALRSDIGAQDVVPPGLGDGGRRDAPAGRVILDIEPAFRPSRDFKITDAHRIGQGGLHEKARDNIAAIRLLKTLEAGNRYATDGQKAILARYVGWGGMPNVLK